MDSAPFSFDRSISSIYENVFLSFGVLPGVSGRIAVGILEMIPELLIRVVCYGAFGVRTRDHVRLSPLVHIEWEALVDVLLPADLLLESVQTPGGGQSCVMHACHASSDAGNGSAKPDEVAA